MTLKDLESRFHELLDAGIDGYATNLEFLDAIASALGCEKPENDEPSDG